MNTTVIRQKNVSVMLLLLFAVHYYIYTTSMEVSREICIVSSSALLGLCLLGVLFLLIDARHIRSRRVFALQIFLIGLAATGSVIRILMQDDGTTVFSRLLSPETLIYCNVGCLIFFGYSFYRMLQQEMSALSLPPTKDECAEKDTRSGVQQRDCGPTTVANDKYRFVDKIPEYKVMLERWMQTEKPYLNKDFKLLDVMQVLPLNRSYLSRMFNEAYNETFFSFIMRYRIEESARLLETRPDLPVVQIAQLCGFSSASVFGRAFLKNKGITPKEYRNR